MTDANARLPHPRSHARSIARACAPALVRALAILLALGLAACQKENDLAPNANSGNAPSAAFTQDATRGIPGLEVQFTDTSSGDIADYAWDFGAAGTSSARNPRIRFDDTGTYTVSLRVTGPTGESTAVKTALVEVAPPAQAGFDCVPKRGFAPLKVLCPSDPSVGDSSVAWDFGDGGSSAEQSPTHTFTTPGEFTVTQTASSAGGDDTATQTIEVFPLSISVTPPTSPTAPSLAEISADVGSVTGIPIWTINGQLVGNGTEFPYLFRQPGTYRIVLVFGEIGTGMVGMAQLDYVVGYGPAVADFRATPAEGTGPLSVVFDDRSVGAISRWNWDFGDGTTCTFPAPVVPGSQPTCNAAGPTHVYDTIGSYDVSLVVTGPGATVGSPDVTDTEAKTDAVRVLMLDASFESQTPNAQIAGAWTHLRPGDAVAPATHIALASTAGGADGAMPSQGTKWAVLDGLGTNGGTGVLQIGNGIEQEFLRPLTNTVLEFDWALLFAEPPAGVVLDAVTATVTDVDSGTVVEIPSARANVSSAYQGVSGRFPTRDGSTMRMTPVATAAIDLAQAFPGSTADSRFRLTIRLTNAVNAFRSPRAYVDHVRFVAPTAVPQIAGFAISDNPVVAGEDVVFTDESCLNPGTGCQVPTSWRWDFGTSQLPTPPTASGSRLQNPTYRFTTPGDYDVTLRVARAGQESEVTLTVTVVGGATAAFETVGTGPFVAPANIQFQDLSTADPGDPIVSWSWDFGGWGSSSQASPAPVTIGQAGDWLIRLEVTTQSGHTSVAERILTVE